MTSTNEIDYYINQRDFLYIADFHKKIKVLLTSSSH